MSESAFRTYLENPPSTEGWQRTQCPTCLSMKIRYCQNCLRILGAPVGVEVPRMSLPLKICVLFAEDRNKSSAVQAAVMSSDVNLMEWPRDFTAPSSLSPEDTVVVYPSDDSITWGDMSLSELSAIRNLLLLDCKWQKGKSILNSPELKGLRRIRIANPPKSSSFWRWHYAGEGCISTIEAIYFMLLEYADAVEAATTNRPSCPVEGSDTGATLPLEHLLFMFAQQHAAIKTAFAQDPALAGKELPMTEKFKQNHRMLRLMPNKLKNGQVDETRENGDEAKSCGAEEEKEVAEDRSPPRKKLPRTSLTADAAAKKLERKAANVYSRSNV